MYDPVDTRDLFICHASKDARLAAHIVAKIEALSVSCWIAPRDVAPGTSFADSLYHALKEAPVFVVLMPRAANASDHVARELALADQMKKPVVPVRLEDFEATGAFCYYTRAAHFYRWRDDPQEVLRRIIEQVRLAKQKRKKGGSARRLLKGQRTHGRTSASSRRRAKRRP